MQMNTAHSRNAPKVDSAMASSASPAYARQTRSCHSVRASAGTAGSAIAGQTNWRARSPPEWIARSSGQLSRLPRRKMHRWRRQAHDGNEIYADCLARGLEMSSPPKERPSQRAAMSRWKLHSYY